MKKPTPYSLYILVPWSLAIIGLLVVLGNLAGLPAYVPNLVPPVEDLPGLVSSSLFLFAVGLLCALVRPLLRPQD